MSQSDGCYRHGCELPKFNSDKVFTACEGTIKAKEDDIKEALIEYHSEVLGQPQLRKKKT